MRNDEPSSSPELYIPEPLFRPGVRPGDTPDFSHIHVRRNDNLERPDVMVDSYETERHAGGLIRVMNMDGVASGPWLPEIPLATLHHGLRAMVLTRLMDDRMFAMQRQGKLSFYLKSRGEEAVSVAQALAVRKSDMVFPTYRQQGILIARDYPKGVWLFFDLRKSRHAVYSGGWLGYGFGL